MADNYKMSATFEADASKLLKGLESIETSVTDVEKILEDAFGDVDGILSDVAKIAKSTGDVLSSSFSGSVSSISGVTGKVEELVEELEDVSNVKINTKGVDDFSKRVIESEGAIIDLHNQMEMMNDVDIDYEEFEKLSKEVLEAGQDIEELESALMGIGDTSIDLSGFDKLGATVSGVEGDVDSLDSTIKGIGGSVDTGGMDKLGSSAKDSEGDVDSLDSAIKGIDSGDLGSVTEDLENISDSAETAIGHLEGMAGAIGGIIGLGSMSDGIGIAIDESRIAYDVETALVAGGQGQNIDVGLNIINEDYGKISSLLGDDGARELIQTISVRVDSDDAEEVANKVKEWGNMATTMEVNFEGVNASEVIDLAGRLATQLGISEEEAMGLQHSLLSLGFPPGELDIINEYGEQLMRAGFNAEEIQGIFAAGVETDSWNIDILMDGLKEGRILIGEFGAGVDDAMSELLEGTDISSKQVQEWGKAVSAGGEDGAKAYIEVAKALEGVDDATKQNELGVKFFGTMWEEQGTNITATIGNMEEHMIPLGEGVDELNNKTGNLDDQPWLRIESAMVDINATIGELLAPVVEFIATLAEFASENEKLTKVILIMVGAITAIITVLGIVTGVIFAVSGAMAILGITSLAVFGWIIVAILAVIAVIALIVVYWDEIKEYLVKFGQWFMELFGVVIEWFKGLWETLVEWFKILWDGVKEIFTEFVEFWKEIWVKNVETAKAMWQAIVDFILMIWNGVVSYFTWLIEFYSNLWTTITSFFKNIWETVINWFTEKWNSTKETFNALKEFIINIWETIKTNVIDRVTSLVNSAIEMFTSLYTSAKENFDNIKTSIGEAIQGAYDTVTGFFGKFKEAGSNLVGNIASGIREGVGKAKDAIVSVLGSLRDMLPFSPVKDKTSPLEDIHKNGIVGNIAKGILSNKDGIKNALREVLDVGDDFDVDDNPFKWGIGNYEKELGATVNGNVKASVETNFDQDNKSDRKQSAYIDLGLGRRDYGFFVEDIFKEQNKAERIKSM